MPRAAHRPWHTCRHRIPTPRARKRRAGVQRFPHRTLRVVVTHHARTPAASQRVFAVSPAYPRGRRRRPVHRRRARTAGRSRVDAAVDRGHRQRADRRQGGDGDGPGLGVLGGPVAARCATDGGRSQSKSSGREATDIFGNTLSGDDRGCLLLQFVSPVVIDQFEREIQDLNAVQDIRDLQAVLMAPDIADPLDRNSSSADSA